MFKRALISLIAVLSCCSLVCVGFSSWYVNDGTDINAESTGSLSSEDIIVSDDYVTVTVVTENFVVTEKRFEPEKNTCDVSFTIKDNNTFEDFVNATNKLIVKLTLTFKNGVTESLQEDAKEALFSNIEFEMIESGAEITVDEPIYTSTHAEFSFTVGNAKSVIGQANALKGKFMFKHTGDNYTNLYEVLAVTSGATAEETTFKNPFSLVVAVSNGE